MPDAINVQDLTEEQVEALKKLVELFRKQKKKGKPRQTEEEEYIFAARPSDVIGKLTREEIYEDL
jgi:hypothetical protein